MIKKSPAGRSERRHQIPVEEIKTWGDFQRVVADYPNWAFRGHGDAEWPLYSSLSRYLQAYKVHTDNWADQEERIVRIFKRKAKTCDSQQRTQRMVTCHEVTNNF